MLRRRPLVVLLAVVALVAVTHARQAPRDAPAPRLTRSGTAVVAGVVTLGDDARTPVRRAVVELLAADRLETLASITDDEGRFTIERVAGGQYTLRASKPAHITIAYGARRAGGVGTPLVIHEGARIADIPLVLPRGAVLAGRVTLFTGQPLPNMQVIAVPARLIAAGGTTPPGTRVFQTNDLGQFRVFGLPGGTYVLAALPTFGRGDIERMPDHVVTELLSRLRQPTGKDVDRTSPPSIVTFEPTYFPGSPSVGEATLIRVGAGEVRDDLQFSITAFPAAAVRGRVVGVDGAPAAAVTLSVEAVGPTLPAVARPAPRTERPGPDGAFQMHGVSPGLYRLRARGTGAAQTQSATLDLHVAGVDINDVVLSMREGQRFSGQVTVDSALTPPAWTGVSVALQPVAGDKNSSIAGILTPGVPRREGPVDQAGRFTVMGLESVEYEIGISLPEALRAQGWWVEAVRHNNRDVRDRPLVFDQESLSDVDVRLTTAVTGLTGTLVSERGTPAANYFIVVFPSDRTLWHTASPRIRVVRPAADGTFRVHALPEGAYRLAALTDVESGEERDPEFLESIHAASIDVLIRRGQVTTQDVRLSGATPTAERR